MFVSIRRGFNIIYSHHSPHPGRRKFLSKLKNKEEFEGGHEKGKGKGGKRRKKEKSDNFFKKISGWPEYILLLYMLLTNIA